MLFSWFWRLSLYCSASNVLFLFPQKRMREKNVFVLFVILSSSSSFSFADDTLFPMRMCQYWTKHGFGHVYGKDREIVSGMWWSQCLIVFICLCVHCDNESCVWIICCASMNDKIVMIDIKCWKCNPILMLLFCQECWCDVCFFQRHHLRPFIIKRVSVFATYFTSFNSIECHEKSLILVHLVHFFCHIKMLPIGLYIQTFHTIAVYILYSMGYKPKYSVYRIQFTVCSNVIEISKLIQLNFSH